MAAAPAPLTTTRMVSIFFPLSSRAFNNPAAEIMARMRISKEYITPKLLQ